jgi:hypothetical protein
LKKSIKVIYVPGLGDKNLKGRRMLLNMWHFRNVSIEICSMRWSIDEPWDTKLERLLKRIEECKQQGDSVTLVGESAGASAVINALSKTDAVNGVVLLCGKSQYPDRVAQYRYNQNPTLRSALIHSNQAVGNLTGPQKQKVLNLYPIFDPVVPVQETKISGVRNAVMPIIGHATSIVFANTLWSWRIVRFARLRARR